MKPYRPYILAIDPATATGICHGQAGGTPSLMTKRFRISPGESNARVWGRAVYFMNGALADCEAVAIEKPPYIIGNTNHATTEFLLGLYGAICGVVESRQIQLHEVAPNAWRKHFFGTGKLARADAKAEAMRRCRYLGWPAPDDNAADAAGIWLWACSQLAPQYAQQAGPLFIGAAS